MADLSLELMRRATFANISDTVYDRIPASDMYQEGACEAESECWRHEDGMWLCSPCLMRFRDGPQYADFPPAAERLAEHIEEHLAARRSRMLIAFHCPRHRRMERPALAS
jgi:ribosomal protein L37AE/L43A